MDAVDYGEGATTRVPGIEGRMGQRRLWGIVSLARRFLASCVDVACAQALEQGVYSYKRGTRWVEFRALWVMRPQLAGGRQRR